MGDRELRAQLEQAQAALAAARAQAGRPVAEDPEVIALERAVADRRARYELDEDRIAELEALVAAELTEMHRLDARLDATHDTRWYENDRDALRRRETGTAGPPINTVLAVLAIFVLLWVFL